MRLSPSLAVYLCLCRAALSYLREVKTRFADNKLVYDTFLEIMKEFKAQRCVSTQQKQHWEKTICAQQ